MSRDLPNMGGRLGEIGSDPKGHLSQLEARLFEAGLEEELQQAEIHAWRQTMEEQTIEAPKALVDARVEEDTEVQKLTALIDEKRNTLAVAEAAAAKGSDDQRSQDLRREVAELEGSLKDLRTVVREHVTLEAERNVRASQAENLASLEHKLRVAAAKKKVLRERYEEESARLGESTSDWIRFRSDQDELEREKRVLELMQHRKLELLTEMGAPGPVKLVRSAPTPEAPVETFPYGMVPLASLAGFFLPFVLVVGYYGVRLCLRVVTSCRAGDQRAV